jgi:hypothetical protein
MLMESQSWIRQSDNTAFFNSVKVNSKNGVSNYKMANRSNRSNHVRNTDHFQNSLQSPLTHNRVMSTSCSQNRNKFDEVKPRVYDYLSHKSPKRILKNQPKIHSFTPKISQRSKMLCKA